MQSYAARCASFTPAARSKSSSFRWPHPDTYLATPSSLASAGFYFNPSAATPDAVSCFLCDKGLADWDPDDDPSHIHAQKCPKCPWAILRCMTDSAEDGSINFATASRHPGSRTMEKARLATFGPESKRWWPHEAKNKGPVSKAMAKAGFIFTPSGSKDDTCICIYCGVELGGWQPEDDPMEEHRMRQSKNGPCPFFTKSTSKPTKQRGRSKSKPPPAVPATSDPDGEGEDEEQIPGNKFSTRTSSTSIRNKRATSSVRLKVSSSKKRNGKDSDNEKTQRSSRSRSRVPNEELRDTHGICPPSTPPQNPEDEDLALEEQALEEQARELMPAEEIVPTPPTPPPPSTATQTSIATTVKFPQLVPEDTLISLTDVERAMTVEQWVRYEMDRQYERLKSDGRQKIDAFKARAAETARQLENL